MKLHYLILLILLTGCTYIPKNSQKAKNKISKYNDKIERIAAYHNFKEINIEKKTVSFVTPEVIGTQKLDINFINEVKVDSVVLENCKDPEQVIKYIREKEKVFEPIVFEDSLLSLKITHGIDGVFVDYKIKSQKQKKEVIVKTETINANIKWYKDRGFWIALGLMLLGLYLIKKYL